MKWCWVMVVAGGLLIASTLGKVSESEPGFELVYRAGTIERLKGKELFHLMLKRARMRYLVKKAIWVTILMGVFLVAMKFLEGHYGFLHVLSFGAVGMMRCETIKGFTVKETEKELRINHPDGMQLVFSKQDPCFRQFIDVEMVRLSFLRNTNGRKVFVQADIGKLFGISRQMTNRRIQLVEKTGDLTALVRREYEKSVLTDAVIKRIAEIIADDWYKTDEEIAAQLLSEGITEKISAGTVNKALCKMDVHFLRSSVRQRIASGQMTPEMGYGYLVHRLFAIIESTCADVSLKPPQEYIELKSLAECMEQKAPSPRGKYKRDVPQKRLSTEQNIARRERVLCMAVEEGWDMNKERPVLCPDCMRPAVALKQKRDRGYKNGACRIEKTTADQYECKNKQCTTKTFTFLPNQLGPWARGSFFLKRKILGLLFEVRGSLRRSCSYVTFETGRQGPLWTTALNWVRKAGRETVQWERLFPIRWSGTLGIDEKWVKRFSEWVYIYEAIDIKTGYPVLKRVFPSCNSDNARAVLLEIKTRGYIPKIVVTDLTRDYDKAVRGLFPNAKHQRCLFHAERAAKDIIRKYLGEDSHKKVRQQLYVLLRELFSAKTSVELETQLTQFLWARDYFPPEANGAFNLVTRIADDLRNPIENPDIPTTNNATESAIKEFDLLYSTTYGYSSLPALQEFLDAYTVYQRFRPYTSGPRKGRCPLEIAGYDIGNLTWDFYLLAS